MLDKYFSNGDIVRFKKLMTVILKQAQFNKSLDEFVMLYNELEWVRKYLTPKMEAHLLDDIQIKNKNPDNESKKDEGGE